MLFNSIDFLIFLPTVFTLYWFVVNRKLHLQNAFILIASYIFYGWWDWKFLGLILLSTVCDYFIAISIDKRENHTIRKRLVFLSLTVNLGLLGVFKYYNFFLENFIEAFTLIGLELDARPLSIILPVGISFYTFQTLSYTLDVYNRKIKATKDFVAFSAFVSFFPQLVAGPIERASHLLPQFLKERKFEYALASAGCKQILWGLLKKVVIADNCAIYANELFNNSDAYPGSALFLGSIFFAFQIYGDFSGYSDIAIGTAKLFGFQLKQNFAFPYFSRDMAEFWRRWHISLSTWFRDYLYIPLGGSRVSTGLQIRNVFIIFLVSGFWHGARWNFIAWGALNALYFIPLLLLKRNRANLEIVAYDRSFPFIKDALRILVTFTLTCLAWIFFRAEDLSQAFEILAKIFSTSFFEPFSIEGDKFLNVHLILVAFFLIVEWNGRRESFGIEQFTENLGQVSRWIFYSFLIFLIGMFMQTIESPFIYFQF